MSRLLIVSNRLPFTVVREKGQIHLEPSVGGLATGVGSIYKTQESLWIGWPGYNVRNLPPKDKDQIMDLLMKEKCYPVSLTSNDIKYYYEGFSNDTIWPLFHYFNLYAKYDQSYWTSYKRVNQKFCDAIMEVAKPDDKFWVHDYHLMLLPNMIRKHLPNAQIGFFLHIPFPSYEIFRILPWREELLEGMLGANLVGFHTYDYVRHFVSSVRRILGYEHTLSELQTATHLVRADLFPMGIDYNRFFSAASSKSVHENVENLRKEIGTQKVILSFDRLDYSKGIPLRLEAMDELLGKNPELRGKVTLFLVAVPSRTNVSQYQMLKKQIDELVGRVNGKYGTTEWTPVRYFSQFLPFDMLVALYSIADVALVTPLRDGMNLMAKEFIASKTSGLGVLILSETAGAAPELGEAIIVNPNNQEDLVRAIEKALALPVEEQQGQNRVMQKRLMRYDISRWVLDFLSRLEEAWRVQQANEEHVMTLKTQKEFITDYRKSKSRLLFLDYDGTLVPLARSPEKAIPTAELLKLLKNLTKAPSTEVVIISGRDRDTLTEWFKSLKVGIVAEHGAWIREASGVTPKVELIPDDWKAKIVPVMELYSDRTPGSFIEEKAHSLVWHYRKADSALGTLRANELKDNLVYLTSNLGLAVMEGNRVVEVGNVTVNKGRAAQYWLSKQKWDFILAVGDDRTDEDLFAVFPPRAYSIKVGLGPSKARFNLAEQREVLPLLRSCIQSEKRGA